MANGKKRVRTLTRLDIAKRIAESRYEKVEDALEWVEAVFTAVRELLKTADPEVRIEIRTFGVFEVKLTKEKPQARNPKTGEIVVVPARRKTHFKPSKFLKEFLQIPLEKLGVTNDGKKIDPNGRGGSAY
ncbi:MAG TPA: HU family DNA-binding protein [Bacteroidota bacterium]|jgi:integration host factor subunit beta|nr:HU family DNA-binding protein [Bacteroidota bacterium]